MISNLHSISGNCGRPSPRIIPSRSPLSPRCLGALVWITAVSIAPGALAQQFESAWIPPPGITANAFVGSEVAISGPWALVGDFGAGTAGTKGEAYFYRRDPGGWTLKQFVRGDPSSALGEGLALDGDVAVIGMPTWDWADSRTGKVLVYELRGEEWIQVQELHPPGLEWFDLFGRGVGVSGDVIVVGAPGVDSKVLANSGEVFVYERRAGRWILVQTFTLRNEKTLGAQKLLGTNVAVEGDRIVAGAPGAYGAAYVYERGPEGWKHVAVLVDETPTVSDVLGWSVAISGDTIVVGEPAVGPESGKANRPGAAFVYERDAAGTWNLVREMQASDGFGGLDFGDRFGSSVAVEGDRIVVGAKTAKNGAKHDGKGYLFERDPTGSWPATETGQLLASNPKSDDLGGAAAMDGGFILLGGPLRSQGGGVYIFEVELGTRYCFQGPNATGKPARLTVTGTESASEQTLVLSVRDCPAGIPGLFLLSSGRESQFLANGSLELCLGPEIRRLSPMATTGPAGVAIHALDFDDPPVAGSLLRGTTWYFQFAYRDGTGGSAGFNLSNAVAVTLE